jgi:hypothetical protein
MNVIPIIISNSLIIFYRHSLYKLCMIMLFVHQPQIHLELSWGHLISPTWAHWGAPSSHQGSLGHGFAAPRFTQTWICAPGNTRVCAWVSLGEPKWPPIHSGSVSSQECTPCSLLACSLNKGTKWFVMLMKEPTQSCDTFVGSVTHSLFVQFWTLLFYHAVMKCKMYCKNIII